MQNFSNSPAPPSLPPGFSGRGGGGPSYPPQPTDPQISPRMTDDYTVMQQQSLHRGHHHPSQASHMLAYGARNRGSGEPPPAQGSIHSGNSSNLYRKEAMEYYFSMGGKDRHRRGGGMGYGAGFGYPNIDGHIPHQYRHAGSGSVSSSGMMSPYPMDYASTAGSGGGGGGVSSSGGAGAFSPSHQYTMSQNPAMQSVPSSQMQHRQHGQNYQSLHQQHRSYPHSAHRMTPQYPHYSPQSGASTGSSGMYSPPPQRYHDGTSGAGFDPKVNSSPSVNSNSNSVSSSAAANNVGPMENVPQSYHTSNYPAYSPQTHSLHKQATLQHRNSQHSLGLAYENSLKMQHHVPSPGSVYAKHHQPSNPSIPHPTSQEIAKSPMHSTVQQTQINQNFSPISNPSPAASAVQSPSCSSSPSPLMGVSEAHGNPSGHAPSHPPPLNPRSSHSHGRLLQTMPQLSPTPNSNSSISSCGSSGSHKAQGMNTAAAGGGHSSTIRSRMGTGMGSRDEVSSVYPSSPLDKLQDAGLNSLNALTSQVANLPNTVQHMLLTDTMLLQKKGKDSGQMQQQAQHATSQSQPRSRNASAASSTSTVKEGSGVCGGDGASSEAGADEDSLVMSEKGPPGAKMERDDQFSEGEHGRMRQMSGASSGSEPTSYYPSSHSQNQPQAVRGSHVKTISSETTKPISVSEMKASETRIPSLSSSPSFGSQTSELGPNSHSRPSVSFTHSSSSNVSLPQSNCVTEPGTTDIDSRYGPRKMIEIKHEGIKGESEGMVERRERGTISQVQRDGEIHVGQDKENRLDVSSLHSNERDGKHHHQASEEQQNASSVGVIVSTRSEGSHPEKHKPSQDNSVEDKHAFFRDSSSHNGEEGVDLSVYSSHHQLHQKPNFGRPQNPPQSGHHKFSYQESPLTDMSGKSRGRPAPVGAVESNSRYPGYHQSQSSYGHVLSKDVAGSVVEASGKRGGDGAGARGHEDNSQIQQFPSLLQEVLQGYNLDRRYGRPEQALPAHLQAQQQFQTRHPYSMAESMRMQTGMAEATPHLSQGASSGKPQQPNQRQGSGPDFGPEPHPSKASAKASQSAEKTKMSVSQSHLAHSTEPPPPKHINLADYSLPQRKPSNLPTPSSAVQELLLQETEPLTGSVGQTESQKSSASLLPPSSERRSVICDVSPNRRSTPERDRESDREREREKSQSGASVIQQPFSSPTAASDLTKKDLGEKQVMKLELASKEAVPEAPNLQAEQHGGFTAKEADMEYHSKSVHPSVVMNADPYRRGNIDMSPMPSHPTSSNPLSPPSRHQAYLHGVDLSAGHTSSFPGYRYGDTREGNMVPRSNPHFPSHHPYHSLSPQAQLQNPQSANKLLYPHPRGGGGGGGGPPHPLDMNDRLDWATAINRPKEVMIQPGSSPGRVKLNQPEQRPRILTQTDVMPNEQHLTKPLLSHQSAYYDMKMWESTHSGREGGVMMEGDPYYRSQPPPPALVAPHAAVPPQLALAATPNAIESEVSRGALEETKQPRPAPASNVTKPLADVNSALPQGQRQSKAGGSGDTNPLMLRRRVRSFISPIPAKRQHQEGPQQRGAQNAHHSPGAQSESSRHNEDDSSSSDIPCTRLSSPTPGQNAYSQALSPSSGKPKVLPPKKGRGLKLEAIVQKITPSVKKHGDSESNHYPGFSHSEMTQFSDSQDQDLAHFPRVAASDDGYMDESHSLNDIIPFRGVDETGPLPPSAYPCDQTSFKQSDFDFGIGTAVAAASGDKEDFALLGPLPPPPPLPRPVQGSPPPSSSALSDIQNFTNTYQQLETRRGEQSAANLLRQKLQETGMGFDDYPGSDYYGTTPPHHSQAQGHMLNRQHQMSSGRSSLSPQDKDSLVPKGYFPSGKKKGRPVGSVNKQKRAQGQNQAQGQTPAQSASPGSPISQLAMSPVAATVIPETEEEEEEEEEQEEEEEEEEEESTSSAPVPMTPPLPDDNHTACLAPPVLTQVVKVDAESEDTPEPEIEVKPLRRRRRGVKDEGDEQAEARGRQRRRRRGGAPTAVAMTTTEAVTDKDDLDTPSWAGGSLSVGFPDQNRKGVFVPHIHVERKIPEIGAVCTIVNAEEEKIKGERSAIGGKAGSSGMESLLTSALTSQLCRRDREIEKRDSEEVETTLQSGKALPSSDYVVSGPVITETNHSGRLLCCLCQKWANYKHLGDLYGPFYPAEYAAKLPKNQPQVRQCQVTTGTNKTGQNIETTSTVLSTIQETATQDAQISKSSTDSDYAASVVRNPTSPGTASLAGGEEMMMYLAAKLGNTAPTTTTTSKTPSLTWDMNLDNRTIPELKREPEIQDDQQHNLQQQQNLQQQDLQQQQNLQLQHNIQQQQTDEAQQRPQHRKLTSHPRFKRRHKSSENSPRMVPSNSKASLPFQPPPPALDSLGPLAQLAQLPQMPMDPEELWVHEGCIVWTSGVYLVNGRLYGLQEALDGARDTCCSYCEMVGSTLGCYSKGCTLQYHYLCAIEADCSLNEDNFSLRCPKHKFPQSSRPPKSVYLEQSERG